MTDWKAILDSFDDLSAEALRHSPVLAVKTAELKKLVISHKAEHDQDAADLGHVVKAFEDIYSRQYAKGAQ